MKVEIPVNFCKFCRVRAKAAVRIIRWKGDYIKCMLEVDGSENQKGTAYIAQLMNGLDSAQNQAWQEQIKNMNQFRQQANLQLQRMNTELNSANPDSKEIKSRAKEMERIMNNWRRDYNTMSSQADEF